MLNDRTIYYQYTEYVHELNMDQTVDYKVISEDEVPEEHVKQINRFFPFTKAENSEHFRVPNWIKSLLYQYYTIKDVKKIIKYFNNGGNIDIDEPYLPFN